MCLKIVLIFAVAALAVAAPFEEIHKPLPYTFGYKIKDKHGEQHREETGDGIGAVKGSYGFTDERGIHRQVHYVADKAGFRAVVKTNEHGTAPLDPAHVKMISSAHPYLGGAGAKVLGGPVLVGLEAAKFLGGPALAGLEASKIFGGPAPVGLEAAKYMGAALAAESPALFGEPVLASLEAPKLFAADLAAKSGYFGSPLAVGGLPFAGSTFYAEPLIGGAITGYDSRFGA